jgi:hypothetical protein
MGKNQSTWSHRTKIIFREINIISTPSEDSRVFPPELSFFDRKTSETLGTHHLKATVTMWFLNICSPTKGIWYLWVNKFSYLLYPHAINILLYRMKPRKHIYRYVKYCSIIFPSWENKFSYFPHQHATNVYYYIVINIFLLISMENNRAIYPCICTMIYCKGQYSCNNPFII